MDLVCLRLSSGGKWRGASAGEGAMSLAMIVEGISLRSSFGGEPRGVGGEKRKFLLVEIPRSSYIVFFPTP